MTDQRETEDFDKSVDGTPLSHSLGWQAEVFRDADQFKDEIERRLPNPDNTQ